VTSRATERRSAALRPLASLCARTIAVSRYQVESGYVSGQNDPAWVLARGERRAMTFGAYRAVFSRINRRLGTN